MYAGMDASGTPDLQGTERKHNPYVLVVAAVDDKEVLERVMADLRTRQGMAAGAEFHAHQMIEERQIAVVKDVMTLELRVGALIIDKPFTREIRGTNDLPSSPEFEVQSRLSLLELFFARYTLRLLQCDEDIKGRARMNQFKTQVKRLHRAKWPGTSLKLQYRKSISSDLVQIADVLAYGLAHLSRQTILLSEWSRLLEEIRNDERNVILGPMAWDR